MGAPINLPLEFEAAWMDWYDNKDNGPVLTRNAEGRLVLKAGAKSLITYAPFIEIVVKDGELYGKCVIHSCDSPASKEGVRLTFSSKRRRRWWRWWRWAARKARKRRRAGRTGAGAGLGAEAGAVAGGVRRVCFMQTVLSPITAPRRHALFCDPGPITHYQRLSPQGGISQWAPLPITKGTPQEAALHNHVHYCITDPYRK